MLFSSLHVVFGFSVGAMLLSWAYFRRYQLARLPIGVFGFGDVMVMIGAVILIPFVHLAPLPRWFVVVLLSLATLGILYFTLEPLLRSTLATWIVVLLVGLTVWSNVWFGERSTLFLILNNSVLALTVVGATNLWAQGGMKARDLAVLAGALAVYDLTATTLLPLMGEMFVHLEGLPFAPLVSWGSSGEQFTIGLGDLLLMPVFALVMRKAFGLTAGMVALAVNVVALAVMMTLLALGSGFVLVPVMTILGPLMVAQYVYWLKRQGCERTTHQYLRAEPLAEPERP